MKKALFTGVLALGMVAVLEIVSFLALAVRDGRLPSPALWRRQRTLVAEENGGAAETSPATAGVRIYDSQVIHPFVGFVYDPSAKFGARNISPQGFPVLPGNEEPSANVTRFHVAIFGGSVAEGFCWVGREAFVKELRSSPRVRGKAIVFHCFAMGGYKQPQQLMALNYALSLGEAIDLAVNIDGFNEVALSIAENLKDGTYPFYPRRWSTRVQGAPAIDSLRLIGRIAALKEERLRKAGLCAARPLAWSPACHLLWTALDRRLAQRAFEAEQELVRLQPRAESFVAHGPVFGDPPRPQVCRVLAEHWARSSTLMSDLCRARGIPYLHFLQPNQYLPGSKSMSREEELVAVRPAHPYRSPVEDCYPVLIDTGRALAGRGIPFQSLTGLFAAHSEPLYADSCCHYNLEGNRLLGQAIGKAAAGALEIRSIRSNGRAASRDRPASPSADRSRTPGLAAGPLPRHSRSPR